MLATDRPSSERNMAHKLIHRRNKQQKCAEESLITEAQKLLIIPSA